MSNIFIELQPVICDLINYYYDDMGNSTGGNCHIALDDGNLNDESLFFCQEECEKAGDYVGLLIATTLRFFTEEQREEMYENGWEFPDSPKTGIELIAEERKRQIEQEGFTAEMDDQYRKCELSLAAACYAASYPIYKHVKSDQGHQFYKLWPWEEEWYKTSPDNRIRDLQKAGALIAAEIDRLQRLKEEQNGKDQTMV